MVRPMRPPVWARALATVAMLLAIRPAGAQNTADYYYETFQYGYNPGYYARRLATLPAWYGSAYAKTAPSQVAVGSRPRYAAVTAPPSAVGGYALKQDSPGDEVV